MSEVAVVTIDTTATPATNTSGKKPVEMTTTTMTPIIDDTWLKELLLALALPRSYVIIARKKVERTAASVDVLVKTSVLQR